MATEQWSAKRGANLADDLDILLGDLCVQWGFCNDLRGGRLIADNESVTGDAFATAVLTAEGMNPEVETEWGRKLKRLFTDRYGSTVSEQTYVPRFGG